MSKDGDSISVTGDLVVWDSDGGFGPDEFLIGVHDLSTIIANLFNLELSGRGSLGDRELGRVKLTIERLETSDSVNPLK